MRSLLETVNICLTLQKNNVASFCVTNPNKFTFVFFLRSFATQLESISNYICILTWKHLTDKHPILCDYCQTFRRLWRMSASEQSALTKWYKKKLFANLFPNEKWWMAIKCANESNICEIAFILKPKLTHENNTNLSDLHPSASDMPC